MTKKSFWKRGEMSSTAIITIILTLIGFSIALFFYFQISGTGKLDRETCFQSVTYRATIPGDTSADQLVQLKCRTEKICITAGLIGGNCKEFEGIKGVTKIKVKDVTQIEKAIAQNIVDCWAMTGEGRVSLFSQYWAKTFGVFGVYPTCIICSRIAFDMEGLSKAGITAEKMALMDVDKYMATHLVPNKNFTYNEYIVGLSPIKLSVKENLGGTTSGVIPPAPSQDTSTLSDEEKRLLEQQKFANEIDTLTSNIKSDQEVMAETVLLKDSQTKEENLALQGKEIATLFMQISAPSHGGSVLNIGKAAAGLAAASLTTAPSTTVKGGKAIGQAIWKLCSIGPPWGYVVCGAILVAAIGYQQGNIAYQRSKTAGVCSDVLVGSEARNGCSVVRTIDYNIDDINQYCAVIESIP